MKIKKKHSAEIELKESWSDKLVEFIDSEDLKIPVMTGMPKGEEKASLHFTSLARLTGMAEIIRDNDKRFKTYSEVHRAAYYIGIMILYKLHRHDCSHPLFKGCAEFEDIMMDMHVMNDVIYMMHQVYTASQKKYISFDKMRDTVEELFNKLPDHLSEIAKVKFKELLHGEKVSNLYELETWGGKRG